MMKALSIKQPWAWLIVNGYKDIENRDWQERNPGLKFRGPFLIHTGKTFDYDGWLWVANNFPDISFFPACDAFKKGGIVGKARIVDVVDHHESPWFFGPKGLVIEGAQPMPFVPCRGQLGFFNVDMGAY